jgi:hypothetical protein
MELAAGWGGDCLLLAGRCCLAAVFAASASSKFRQVPAEIKVLANLHFLRQRPSNCLSASVRPLERLH